MSAEPSGVGEVVVGTREHGAAHDFPLAYPRPEPLSAPATIERRQETEGG